PGEPSEVEWTEATAEPRVRSPREVLPPGRLPERRVVVIGENAEIDIEAAREPLVQVPQGAGPPVGRASDIGETLQDDGEASIREVGILQPLVVRRAGDGRYELIAGERRLRAAKAAGLASVPIVLRDSEDADLLREALIENIHREDLNPIEQAEAFKALLGELGLKQEELADRVGVSRSHIANTIRLLALPLDVRQLLADDKITAGHARAVLSLGDKE